MLPLKYCEAAGFISRGGATNCILWAQSKLNINIDCGFSGSPANCQPITEDEFYNIKANLNNGPRLQEIVEKTQRRLVRRLGLYSGGVSKKRRNIKRKNKNKKSNKKSNKKTKKNNKSKR